MNSNFRNFALWAIIALLLIALFQLFQNPGQKSNTRDIAFSQFLSEVDLGLVSSVLIQDQQISGKFASGEDFHDICSAGRQLHRNSERPWRGDKG